MDLIPRDIDEGLALAARVEPRYAPVFVGLSPARRAALAWYFLPHRSGKAVLGVTRPRVLKWYCPFADQRAFPSGHRYCLNVYVGCGHRCSYCYAAGYEVAEAHCKDRFLADLRRDLEDLERFDVPPAPVHLSNSTDPLQPLEEQAGHTRLALAELARYRARFTSVVLLTKNPALAARPEYLDVLTALMPGVRIEVSLAFRREAARRFYDAAAPPVADRLAAVSTLRAAGLPVVLRVDPLLPREPLPNGLRLADFGLPAAQSLADLEELVTFARDRELLHLVYSVAKIVVPRGRPLPEPMARLKRLYEALAGRLIFRGGSWRLPEAVARPLIVQPFVDLAERHGRRALFCMQNLVTTP